MNLYEMFEQSQELTLVDALRDFLPLAVRELGLQTVPKIKLARNLHDTHVPTFGRYQNGPEVITVDIENRHPVDILRTIAHEMVHYGQDIEDRLHDESWRTGSAEENEANAGAGVIMRKFNTEFPQYLQLKPVLLPELNNKQNLDEGFAKNVALVAALANLLASAPAVAEPTAAAQAIGIARQINRMKGYGPEAAQAEAYQELKNLIRALGGTEVNHSKIYPLIKDMVKTPGELPTEVEQLPPLTGEPVNEKWSQKYKRSIDCNNPKGFSQRAHCQGRKKSNEDTCKTHTSPTGVKTNMCPDDDDYEINYGKHGAARANENFADGKKPGRKGLAKRVGVNCKQSVSKLRKIAKNSSGERQRMAHWCANMKSGRNK